MLCLICRKETKFQYLHFFCNLIIDNRSICKQSLILNLVCIMNFFIATFLQSVVFLLRLCRKLNDSSKGTSTNEMAIKGMNIYINHKTELTFT